MKKNVLRGKSMDFAIKIVYLQKSLVQERKEFSLSKQITRSGTSVGAMIREAEHSESKADFVHKMAIAQKEINETLYWLELLQATDYLTPENYKKLETDALEILRILTATLKTAKKTLSNNS